MIRILALLLFILLSSQLIAMDPNSQQVDIKNISLHDLQWKNRVVIVEINKPQEALQIKQIYEAAKAEFDERNITIFVAVDEATDKAVSNEALRSLNNNAITALSIYIDNTDLLNRLQGSKAILIGLDGGIKASYDSFDKRQIFADIDQMPMRRQQIFREQSSP